MIDKYPIVKKQVTFSAPPEMIFFDMDVDEDYDPEEVDFIRLDDLLGEAPEAGPAPAEDPKPLEPAPKKTRPLIGQTCFTLIPRRRYRFIDAKISPVIRRSLSMTAMEQKRELLLTRVRPLYLQWVLDIEFGEDPVRIMGEFRRNLEIEMRPFLLRDLYANEFFWADECLIRPADETLTVNQMVRFINSYQK